MLLSVKSTFGVLQISTYDGKLKELIKNFVRCVTVRYIWSASFPLLPYRNETYRILYCVHIFSWHSPVHPSTTHPSAGIRVLSQPLIPHIHSCVNKCIHLLYNSVSRFVCKKRLRFHMHFRLQLFDFLISWTSCSNRMELTHHVM